MEKNNSNKVKDQKKYRVPRRKMPKKSANKIIKRALAAMENTSGDDLVIFQRSILDGQG